MTQYTFNIIYSPTLCGESTFPDLVVLAKEKSLVDFSFPHIKCKFHQFSAISAIT